MNDPLSVVPTSFFDRETLSSFDFYNVKIESLPIKENLVPKIVKAKFAKCGLKSIPEELFSYVNIRELDLSDNHLSDFNSYNFLNFDHLTKLDLSFNMISNVTCMMPKTLIILDLSFNQTLDIDSVWNLAVPMLETLKLNNCRLKNLPETTPKWAQTIKNIQLDGNFINHIPNCLQKFPNLEDISLFGNMIGKASIKSFDHPLRSLNLAMNMLESIEISEIELQILNVSYCHIKQVSQNYMMIDGLKVLHLNNCCISGILDIELTENLAIFNASNNKITGVSETFANSITRLSVLNLSNNEIESLPDSFQNCICLSQLYLNHNKLQKLPKSIMHSKLMEKFIVSHNYLTCLEEFHFPQLREFDVSFNELTFIPDSFEKSSYLISINVSCNFLTDIPHSLISCRKVITLYANNNLFTSLPACILSFAMLRNLYVSGNQLTSLPLSLSSFFFLTTLDISNNHFQTLPSFTENFFGLKFLNASHNLIGDISDGNVKFPNKLQFLDLSFNLIKTFQSSTLSQLNSLALDFNQLESFEIQPTETLSILTVSNNNQISVDINKFMNDFPNLKTIEAFNVKNIIDNRTVPFFPSITFKSQNTNSSVENNINATLNCLNNENNNENNSYINDYNSNNENDITKAENGSRKSIINNLHLISSENDIFVGDTIYGIGYSSTIGVRQTMEDSIAIHSDKNVSIFALFDGHAGSSASIIAASMIKNEVAQIENPDSDFSKIFLNIQNKLRSNHVVDGCTGIISLIINDICYVAGIGDSRVILIRNNEVRRITKDEKPLDESEYRRLQEIGIGVSSDGRVQRKLSVGRSFGDFWCTQELFLVPIVTSFHITENDLSLILACDGLWDVSKDEEVAKIYRSSKSAQDGATFLKNFAIANGSQDNISILTVDFHPDNSQTGFCSLNLIERLPIIPEKDSENDQPLCLSPPSPGKRRSRR
ncbi:hypothetical protein TRFO_07686 [Tritrichomonas foetus]|uniref:PPM-type phosphatase domain-containing protein n=1 Tax=Tritrichomonas foetus TaxID=1144522 RepID=A0A1J4JQI9_9EUKA|nr:hypothetical protein TRFO_07686 [Tritrichomonas foetus]|eukprot:OHT01018.1 hypothetical protein TRFO_07686 [Tritrichomonas foetus]